MLLCYTQRPPRTHGGSCSGKLAEKTCVPSCLDSQKGATYDRPQISVISHPHGGPWCCLHSLRASANTSTRRDRPLRLPCPPPLAPRWTDNSLVLLGFHLYGPRHARSD